MKSTLKRVLGRSGWYLRKMSGLPGGTDFFRDVSHLGIAPKTTILDIGAHHGQTALEFTEHFPGATIYSFEPEAENFRSLQHNVRYCRNVVCINSAAGPHCGQAELSLDDNTQKHSLVPISDRKELVDITTIDSFCRERSLRTIDLLKIDVEGYELQTLRGASETLKTTAAIFSEATLLTDDTEHTHLSSLMAALHDFEVAGIYNQDQSCSHLSFFNVLFVRKS